MLYKLRFITHSFAMGTKNLLIIGGTGIIGTQVAAEAAKRGYTVCVVTLEKIHLPRQINQVVIDRTSHSYAPAIQNLNQDVGMWDLVVDVIAVDEVSARSTYELFKNYANHIISISTVLVYDRSICSAAPITETNQLVGKGLYGGYVDGKLGLENFWASVHDVPWSIVRPYHILGAGSLLGCLPEHNRDPRLLSTIRNGSPIKLCEGGDVEFNYIHPRDIALSLFAIAGNKRTYGQAYNLVNPEIITAKDYYAEIAKQINGKLIIENLSVRQVWRELQKWELTTLPHVYNVQKLTDDTGFTANIPLSVGVEDAIANYPELSISPEEIPIHQRMNKMPRPQVIQWLDDYYMRRRAV